MKRYKLERDLPTFKAGEIFYISDAGNLLRESDNIAAYSWTTLEKFPNILDDWFEEIEEPLIKDEKIRKAVRAWAEANEITQVSHDACWNAFRCSDFVIAFDYDFDRHDGLEDMKSYTIDELCGEEEE